jgi:uncharacterized protein YaaR (DUF327 family)
MDDMRNYILDEKNKSVIANAIYRRYYERYLKLFFYENAESSAYTDEQGNSNKKNVFKTEYKNGFLMMASSSLLIETLASFINGNNKTPRGESEKSFKLIFSKAEEYGNNLKEFKIINYYSDIRCAILHQGETYTKYKIQRTGPLLDDSRNEINATRFTELLRDFLQSYVKELKQSKWDSDLWDNCRIKIRHIITNAS